MKLIVHENLPAERQKESVEGEGRNRKQFQLQVSLFTP
jgi:hypothetical protein